MNLLRKAATWLLSRWAEDGPRYFGAEEAHSGETVTEVSALSLSAVWGCVNLLAGSIASLPIEVKRRRSDGFEEVVGDHSLARVLGESPNYDQSAMEFWEGATARLELRGNAIARKVVSGARLVSLEPVFGDVSVTRDRSGGLRYRWTQDGRAWDLSETDVFHLRGFGGNPLGGMSTLSAARNAIGLSQAIERSAGSTFRNGLRPSGALAFKEFLTNEQRKVAEDALATKFAGAMNSGRPMILEGSAQWVPFSIDPEEAQLLASRSFSVEDICRFFGVPPFLVGHTEKSTSWGTGLEQQTLGYVKFSLRKRLKRIEKAISKQLLSPADRANGIVVAFNLDGLLRGDSAARASFYKSMTEAGVMTINECRRREGLPPVPGGDVPRMQSQNVPITAPTGATGGPALVDGGAA